MLFYWIIEIDWKKVLEDCFTEVEVEDSKVEEIINDLFAGKFVLYISCFFLKISLECVYNHEGSLMWHY